MKNKFVLSLFSIFSIHYCPAQEITNHDIVSVTKITFLNPGISHEARIAKLQSVYLQAFMNTSAYFFSSSSFGTSAGVYFEPAFTIQYRYYYNATKRESRGKRTAVNNMNYISPVFEMMFSDNRLKSSDYPEENARPITRLAFVWGMQRNYNKRFSLDFNLGFGWLFAKGTTLGELGQKIRVHHSQPILAGQLNLGFWLGKKTL